MSAHLENYVVVETVTPIVDSIAATRRALPTAPATYLSADVLKKLDAESNKAYSVVDDMVLRLASPLDEQQKYTVNRIYYFPAVAYTAIREIFENLQHEDFESSESHSLERHMILVSMWSVVVRKSSKEPKNPREGKEIMEKAMLHVIQEAQGSGLYDLLVKFTRELGIQWANLTPQEHRILDKEAKDFCEEGLTIGVVRLAAYLVRSKANALAAAAGERKPWSETATLPVIGKLLAAPDASATSSGGLHPAGQSEDSLAVVSPRKRAIYGFSSAL